MLLKCLQSKRSITILIPAVLVLMAPVRSAGQGATCALCSAQSVEVPPYSAPWVITFGGCCSESSGQWTCVMQGIGECPMTWYYNSTNVCEEATECVPPLPEILHAFEKGVRAKDQQAVRRLLTAYPVNLALNHERRTLQVLGCQREVLVNLPVDDQMFAHALDQPGMSGTIHATPPSSTDARARMRSHEQGVP